MAELIGLNWKCHKVAEKPSRKSKAETQKRANNESLIKQNFFKMKIRPANQSDLEDIFEWRNDASSQSMSLRSKKITLSEHLEWYHRSLENPHRKLYVGVINGEKIGIVRFDFESAGDVSEISINLNPRFRGMGHGLTLLSKSIIIHTKSNGGALAATIKKGNCASLKIFYKCGFQKEAENEFLYHLRRD